MKEGGAEMPLYLSANNLKPFVDTELGLALKSPVLYRPKGGGGTAYGRKAELLPKICDVLLKARDAGKLRGQGHIAAQAEILVRGFAHVGIIALVDEATGYQYLRAREALEEILEKFIATEFRKWAKTFPDEFYRELFRLRGWPFKESTVKRTPLIGKLTLDLVYDRLAPGVRRRLEEVNPKNEKGHRKHKLFQRLTEDIGDPSLRAHLASVITLMKVNDGDDQWKDFMKMMNRALPKYKPLPLFDQPQLERGSA
ncbi:MAG: P63C domain-containing protein [Acidobacteria bacterium]|nr:P63C domain-containing protein [Acidobacteriota bacterium]